MSSNNTQIAQTMYPLCQYSAASQRTITPYTSTDSKYSTSSTSSTSSMKSIGKKVGKFMKSLIEPPTDSNNLGYHSPSKRGLVPTSNLGGFTFPRRA